MCCAARSVHKVPIIPLDQLKMSDAAAQAQRIVEADLFPKQMKIFKLSYCGGLLDSDGCATISFSNGRLTITVMYAQSNPAALSMLAHTFALHGIPIEHASLHSIQHSWQLCSHSTAA